MRIIHVLGGGDTAVIGAGGNATVNVGVTIDSLTINGGSAVTICNFTSAGANYPVIDVSGTLSSNIFIAVLFFILFSQILSKLVT
ncbi:MAG: hypothetical protein A2015_00695 [Spirochaetes bacterium GWF1_31_7]|nr:MAG: hypothetical protein A2Y30_12560 [Spirochaetes bacterium GWE1_32_154]OHD48954.1 MAG: hypothetical protein A2Y29_04995 [Spirochaetes bacterium GWE2_31_10]OHD51894.1 MAG: hypothetical protein A2015_00695 [Spirochaetes bacterium GWF1_31_7]OHD75122.1 MAG: hypothetical protein A2355_08565 [Spirochaetes bacterium RIFOXYB1_FULL_32_8]HBD93770.1 hypothetical protein [Spirochaetia bacterium]